MCSPCNLSNSTEDGYPNQSYLNHYLRMAEGECGLIIPGYVYHMNSGKACKLQNGMVNDTHAEAWSSTIEKIHSHGSKVIFQVCHGGVQSNQDVNPNPKGASAIIPGTQELSIADIEEIIHEYVNCTKRLKRINADGIQLHHAHGYLLSAFLSPIMNKRTDKYGGSFENRARLTVEICEAISKVIDDNFLLTMKVNGSDCVDGGTEPEDVARLIKLLPRMDLAEISCGLGNFALTIRSRWNSKHVTKGLPKNLADIVRNADRNADPRYPLTEGYTFNFAKTIKKLCPNTIIASVGGYQYYLVMENSLKSESVDIISIGRPFIREPDLCKKLRTGVSDSVECSRCGQCLLFPQFDPPCRCFSKEGFVAKMKTK